MPQHSPADDLPLDLRLDLLVDGELPENPRRELLIALEHPPDQWRAVALRFLQRQTEKQSVHALMAGGNLIPVPLAPPVRRPFIGRVGWYRITMTAAGLLIAVTSALVTLVAVRTPGVSPVVRSRAEFRTNLPADLVAADRAVPVSVQVVPAGDNPTLFPISSVDKPRPTKTTILVQPDGNGSYMVIPVSMSKTQVY
jgi:hypothetical protein